MNYNSGDRLPANFELAKIFNVSVKTIHDSIKLLAKQGIYSYTHSVNNAYFAKEFMKLGVYGVYSDFLSPAQVNNSYIRANCPKFASRYVKTIMPGINQ